MDKLASLFEPALVRDYVVWTFIFQYACSDDILQVKEEDISFVTATNPLIKGSRPYIVFDATGEAVTLTPSFHVS